MKVTLIIFCIIYAVISLLAMEYMNKQIQLLQNTTVKQGKVIKHLAERCDFLNDKINASDKMIAHVSTNMSKRFERHKSWTYQITSDMANQIAEMTDGFREEANETGETTNAEN